MEWKIKHPIWGKFSMKADGIFEMSSKSLVGDVEDSGGSILFGETLVPKQTGNFKFHKKMSLIPKHHKAHILGLTIFKI